ncbi:27367_t:CDS:2 [Racocetra persica]|uniref:27367_t:CDS:1 n=2 Tax=Racocetra persica TaxID=160502 RepID=A0ACA9KHA7_9GLOM|nr:27366_t:CDS:2 [Racocetra persica]CAG8470504.1 27367_t:CDS:2 [Racocetra persica]
MEEVVLEQQMNIISQPIVTNLPRQREDQPEIPLKYSNNDDNFFDNYKKEETEEVESYCTNGSADDEELYVNL